mgnify:CR=1 FL=1
MSLHRPYITLTGFITALAFSASAYAGLYGFTSANPYTYEEQILDIKVAPKTIVNYRKAMRDNVVALAEFAKAENKDFEIIAHEGEVFGARACGNTILTVTTKRGAKALMPTTRSFWRI